MLSINLYKQALDASILEWEKLAERFRDLDSKAQATARISGIFIAAAFAFIQQLSSQK